MWNGNLGEAGEFVLIGEQLTVLLAGVGDDCTPLEGLDGEQVAKDIEEGKYLVRNFVKKVQLDIKKLAQAGAHSIRSIAEFSCGKAFAASVELNMVPKARVAVKDEGQRQTWLSLDIDAKMMPMVQTEEVAMEYQAMELSDGLEITFFVDTGKLRAAWLKATAALYTAFASRAQAEDPRFSEKVFARHLGFSSQRLKEFVACECHLESVAASTLKSIEDHVCKLRANEFAALSAAIDEINGISKKRGTPASATQDTPVFMQTPTEDAGVPTSAKQTKQSRIKFNAEEKKWLSENIGKYIKEYKNASGDARAMLVEGVLQEAKETSELRANEWTISTIKNQFKNFN